MSVSAVVGQPVSSRFQGICLRSSEVPAAGPLNFHRLTTSIATVDANGIVTLLAPGSVTISGRG
jgi:hypothetical protein